MFKILNARKINVGRKMIEPVRGSNLFFSTSVKLTEYSAMSPQCLNFEHSTYIGLCEFLKAIICFFRASSRFLYMYRLHLHPPLTQQNINSNFSKTDQYIDL